jgi:hypothetical protein
MSAVAKVLEISLGIQISKNSKLGYLITFMRRRGIIEEKKLNLSCNRQSRVIEKYY